LKDILDDDGYHSIRGIKKTHEKSLYCKEQKLKQIHKSVCYFEGKMEDRRKALCDKTQRSKNKTYMQRKCYWQDAWKEMKSPREGTQQTGDALRGFIFSDEYTCNA